MPRKTANKNSRGQRAALWLGAVTVLAAIAGCGGGGGAATPAAPGPQLAPGGLYVGYYAEDPSTNPEDPTLGVLHLVLPAGDAAFSGAMFFTYVGCQSTNVGVVAGARSGNALTGSWSGTLDGLAQSGSYAGNYTSAAGVFSGTYTVAGGKQFRDLRPCIQYYIAPNGTWELLAAGASVPASFVLTPTGTQVRWTNPATTAITLVAVIDEAQALAGQAAANRFQVFSAGNPGAQSFDLATVAGLTAGRRYVVTVAAANAQGQRLAAGSVVLTR